MVKTTVHLPGELGPRPDAESAASGVSKAAELIRRGIAELLDRSPRPRNDRPLPVFNSGRPLTPERMDDASHEHIKERAARR
ncbi:CopG family transcriptional regulator [Streptomyces sp. H27-C3]|uniref:CopG family transcriptional regulator n=1 Tax=Streptomyces sp. H27-C3 TaxID=3046305 RepID=UPI0024BABAB8|nr:CopG family transcriptional regulator [Streptomyces sp. H27-C3]MDJ0465098.1 CopG family transcriptional regulator [Streptomyces sp. H27-C3]